MNKYNELLDMESENSLSILLKYIKDGTRVLEFGCAYGRMTKYLSEQKNCTVDIVEIDDVAGMEAAKYAKLSCIGVIDGDINTGKWMELLIGQQYDYIIFADVLEHLMWPEKVLRNCGKYLKEDGAILLSVPNIAHNAVLIELMNNQLKYRDKGILDDTHIRFFTYNSLKTMIQRAGYQTVVERATFCPVEYTELNVNYDFVDQSTAKVLKHRQYGNAYQFIFELKNNKFLCETPQLKDINLDGGSDYKYVVYLKKNLNDVFSENLKLEKTFTGNHIIDTIKYESDEGIQAIRLDPINANCILKLNTIEIETNGELRNYLDTVVSNGEKLGNGLYVFDTMDPQFYIEFPEKINSFVMKFKYELVEYDSITASLLMQIKVDLDSFAELQRMIKDTEFHEMKLQLENELELEKSRFAELQKEYLDKEAILNKQNAYLNEALEDLKVKIENEEDEHNKELQVQLNYYIEHYHTAIDQREDLSRQLSHYQQHYHAAINQRDDLNAQVVQLQSMYDAVTNSTCWKMTKPIRGVLDIIKSLLKKNRYTHLFYKGLRSLKNNGFSITWNKVKRWMNYKNAYKVVATISLFTEEELEQQKKIVFPRKVKFSILVPLYNTPEQFLREMIQSVQAQTYGNWELCLADGSDTFHIDVEKICKEYAKKDKRIKYKKLEQNLGISGNTNACIEMATGDYIALFDHDDLLHPAALFEVMKAICEKNADFIYTDENTFHTTPEDAYCPHYKPDFAPDTLRSYNYICHFTVFKKDLLDITGGFRSEFDGSQDYDMVLRLTEVAENIVHIPKILYYWRSHAGSVASEISAKPYTIVAAKKALAEHLERVGLKGTVEDANILSTYKINYEIDGQPLISILIPNKDHIAELKVCIDSIREKSTYTNWEIIIIENNSVEEITFAYYDELQKDSRIRVVYWDGKFNYSAINNYGLQFAKGEYVLLLNNDVEIISPDWLEQMLMFAQRKDIGAVGAMLYYPDDTIQHAGVVLGIGGVAGHSHKYFKRGEYGYASRLQITQNYSAVTAACVMIPRKVLDEVNGLDESFEVAFNDVDLCMRIRQAGYLIVWTPYAELYHYESKSRGLEDTPEKQQRFAGEVQRFQARWGKELDAGDPYYNPNLTLVREDFSLK